MRAATRSRVADLFAFAVGEEVLAAEALAGTQKQPGAGGQSAQALVQETGRTARSAAVAVTKLRVQPLARLADKEALRRLGVGAGREGVVGPTLRTCG